jgi:hypothetical protein
MNFETRVGHGNARDLLKAEKGTLSWERIGGGKIRFKTSSWHDAVVTTRSQVLEIAMVDHLPALVKATKPISTSKRRASKRPVTVPKRNKVTTSRLSDSVTE